MGRYRVGVDIGGTNTDLAIFDSDTGALLVEKVPSTPSNPALAVLSGLRLLVERGVQLKDIEFFSHGTTVTTNALLEMKGSRVGLLITDGFRGVGEVQEQARTGNQLDYYFRRPTPLVPPSLTREIPGRMDYTGAELTPLDEQAVRRAVRELVDAGIKSFAVCYLFSFKNPAHEQATARIIREVAPDATVSLSSTVLPRVREWPRLSTTLVNAFLEPVLVRYIASLDQGLDDIKVGTRQRFLMQSNGGVMPFVAVGKGGRTVQTLLSGPAGGVRAAAHIMAVQLGFRHLITMDMGGTSCDIAFVEGGAPLEVTEGYVDGRRVDVPAFDITAISAGGGSVAWLDAAGLLNIGPESAGAAPGPACYRNGGMRPTVTDADLVCGYLNPSHMLGGALKLDGAAAETAIARDIATPMKVTPADAASGIVRLVNARMADEIRIQAARKGVDLTDYTLIPFGGAGPVHAVAVAADLGIPRVLVPPNPGAFSALGLLCADILHDYVRSGLTPLAELKPADAESAFCQLEEQARADMADEGLSDAEHRLVRELDMRYTGQGYELRVSLEGLGDGPVTADILAAAREHFFTVHRALHGHASTDTPVEVVSDRLRVVVPVPKAAASVGVVPARQREGEQRRVVRFGTDAPVSTRVISRAGLAVGEVIKGPIIVEQFDATTVIPPRWSAHLDKHGNLIVEAER